MVILWYYVRDFFVFVGELIKNISLLIVNLIRLVGAYGSAVVDILGVLPTVFVTFGSIIIVIMILYKILGRNSKEE